MLLAREAGVGVDESLARAARRRCRAARDGKQEKPHPPGTPRIRAQCAPARAP
ncbi:MAG: hypothetical protein MZV70_07980 [Desulfobacterales bacterium]|nr:hypothetical protein [Desulfobacterales bacterium]